MYSCVWHPIGIFFLIIWVILWFVISGMSFITFWLSRLTVHEFCFFRIQLEDAIISMCPLKHLWSHRAVGLILCFSSIFQRTEIVRQVRVICKQEFEAVVIFLSMEDCFFLNFYPDRYILSYYHSFAMKKYQEHKQKSVNI